MREKIKTKFRSLPTAKKIELFAAIILIAAVIASVSTFAWFSHKRSLAAMTKVNSPTTLYISAGHNESVANFDLADIDVVNYDDEGKRIASSKDYVFGVSGNSIESYVLQLAHTTNIPFTYTIYKAEESGSQKNADVVYVDEDGASWYYTKGSRLAGGYLNDDGTGTANDSKHETTYGDYSADNVQKNAEPLYWQSDTVTVENSDGDGNFIDYYILTVSWGDNLTNDKETDIVYITAGVVG